MPALSEGAGKGGGEGVEGGAYSISKHSWKGVLVREEDLIGSRRILNRFKQRLLLERSLFETELLEFD